ncbi:MAG: hypothetical protein NT029_09210 [Armatimonadetes bacterium]|nr:hypothetical protein [Armatimonadota bacterium]
MGLIGRIRERLAQRRALPDAVRPLGRRVPVRQVYDRWARDAAFAGADLAILGERLRGTPFRWRERAAAAWMLGLVRDPEQRAGAEAALIEALHPKARNGWIKASRWSFVGCCVGFSPFVLPAVLSLAAAARFEDRVRLMAARSLAMVGGPASAPVLCAAACDSNATLAEAARLALPVALDGLTADHYGLMPPEMTDQLAGLLKAAPDSAWQMKWATDPAGTGSSVLHISVLRALRAVGAGRALEPVRAFALKCADPEEQQAAAQAIAVLQQRATLEAQSATLLRPASNPHSPGDILVRPAAPGAWGDAALLVRPSAAPEGEGDNEVNTVKNVPSS